MPPMAGRDQDGPEAQSGDRPGRPRDKLLDLVTVVPLAELAAGNPEVVTSRAGQKKRRKEKRRYNHR